MPKMHNRRKELPKMKKENLMIRGNLKKLQLKRREMKINYDLCHP